MTSAAPALVFDRVTVRYEPDASPAVDNVSFSLAAGERAALVGLNGSGKTTLLLAAVGLVPYEGEIRVCGTPVSRRTAAEVRDRIGFLFNLPDDQLLFPKVIEDAAFGLLRRGVNRAEAYRKAVLALDSLGIEGLAEWPLQHLSHGQKQRVALAGAMITAPPLLLLDEPSASLDPPGRRALGGILGRLDAAMLIATHDLDFGRRLCRRLILLESGKVAHDGEDLSTIQRLWRLD